MKSAASTIDSFKKAAIGGLAALGVSISARAFAGWVKGAMDASDAVHDMARELGISNEKLAEYHHAAKMAGVDSGTFDNSLEKLNKNLGAIAESGTGPAADALRHYGLSARALANAGPDEAFRQSLDLLARIPNAAQRAAVATELFGKSGQAMIRLAGEGAGALDRMGEEAKALGVAISDVDSEKIAEANDALDRVWAAIQGVANAIAVKLSPYLKYAADLMVDFAKEGMRGGSLVSQGFDFIADSIVRASDVVNLLKGSFHYLASAFAEVVGGILDGMVKFGEGIEWILKKLGQTRLEGIDTAREIAAAFHKVAIAKLDASDAAFGAPSDRPAVRKFIDDINLGAQKRAELADAREKQSRKGGAFQRTKLVETKFAGGEATQGSAAAYSAIVQARGAQQTSMQTRIAADTKTTAEATTRVAAGVGRLVDIATRTVQGDAAMMPGTGA